MHTKNHKVCTHLMCFTSAHFVESRMRVWQTCRQFINYGKRHIGAITQKLKLNSVKYISPMESVSQTIKFTWTFLIVIFILYVINKIQPVNIDMLNVHVRNLHIFKFTSMSSISMSCTNICRALWIAAWAHCHFPWYDFLPSIWDLGVKPVIQDQNRITVANWRADNAGRCSIWFPYDSHWLDTAPSALAHTHEWMTTDATNDFRTQTPPIANCEFVNESLHN